MTQKCIYGSAELHKSTGCWLSGTELPVDITEEGADDK